MKWFNWKCVYRLSVGLAAFGVGLGLAEPARQHPTGKAEGPTAPWVFPIQRVHAALAGQQVDAAEAAWHDAYTAALGGRDWRGLLAVGDASLRLGEVTQSPGLGEARARANYMAALFMARQQASLDGVLRVAGAFSTLGDHETVERCIATAERLAAAAQGPSSHPAFATERSAF